MIDTVPFFILANPRSGSSMLRIICESHSQLSVPPESGFMEWWYSKYGSWHLDDSKNNERVFDFVFDLMSSKKIETWQLDEEALIKLILSEKPKSYAALISLVYITFANMKGKRIAYWGDKNNYYIHKTQLLHNLYPNAKYIHLVRDGRDVATSYKALQDIEATSPYAPKLNTEIEEIAAEWDQNNKTLLVFFRQIDSEKVLRIRFEDVLENLEESCKTICSFLDVPFDNKMLQYYKWNKKLAIEPSETMAWKQKTLEKPDLGTIGKYKKLLNKKEIEIFNMIAKDTLKEFGYA